jgi:hypothetical protein
MRLALRRYVECVMAQRVGPVKIDDDNDDDDLTVILVPSEAVGFVTGAQGNFLRQVEEEWGTLMFFADFRGRAERKEVTAPAAARARRARLAARGEPAARSSASRTSRASSRRSACCGSRPSRCAR